VAALETRRGYLLALTAYERSRDPRALDESDYPRWRVRYLRTDPEGSLTRAARAAEAALRADRAAGGAALPPPARRQAFLLLATARNGLGDPNGEARALAAAAGHEPRRQELWLRLAEAYARAHRFSRAEAAMLRALKGGP
jgi:hypothetical protein